MSMTHGEILAYQAEARAFAATEIGGLLHAFILAHGRAWVTDQHDAASLASIDRAWQKSKDAQDALVAAIKRLQAERAP